MALQDDSSAQFAQLLAAINKVEANVDAKLSQMKRELMEERESTDDRCHKILGPPLEWGPILLTLWAPHRDFGPPLELALLARREVAFITAIYPMQSCQNLPSIL